MTPIAVLAVVLLLAHRGPAPRGSMDPAAAAPPIENGTPAMAATKPAPSTEAGQQGNASISATETPKLSPRSPPRHHRRKTTQH